jgi:hypothetical protein
MPHIIGTQRPGIADVQCRRLQFQPGDRVIVEVFEKIDEDYRKKLRKSIRKWAGCEVEVLIYDATKFKVTVENE